MTQNTHLAISPRLVGEVLRVAPGEAAAALTATDDMAADARGLVHGGFTFGLADFAAMVAVNDPFVVLGAAETRFLAPVRVGERMEARAKVVGDKGKRRVVDVTVAVDERPVMTGTFTCFVLERHVLDA